MLEVQEVSLLRRFARQAQHGDRGQRGAADCQEEQLTCNLNSSLAVVCASNVIVGWLIPLPTDQILIYYVSCGHVS